MVLYKIIIFNFESNIKNYELRENNICSYKIETTTNIT